MPRVVDHDVRREAIADAVYRVVRREGMPALSVRTVAAEAGLSASALRHYFPSQDHLLAFALTRAVDRARRRLPDDVREWAGRAGAELVLGQLLPLDEATREETEVYLAFVMRAQTEPALAGLREGAEALTRQAVTLALELLARGGGLAAARDREAETTRLHALLDGLALQGVVWPGRHGPQAIRAVLRDHLDELAGPPGAGDRGATGDLATAG